jgi:hypothetical protein
MSAGKAEAAVGKERSKSNETASGQRRADIMPDLLLSEVRS